jgi:hypothetical protein
MSGEQLRAFLKAIAAHELEPSEAWHRVVRDVEKLVHDLHREIKTQNEKLQDRNAENRARDVSERATRDRLEAAVRENMALKARIAALEARVRKADEQERLLANQNKKNNLAATLPPPMPLRRALSIKYEWGEQKFDIVASACSIRTTLWEETDQEVTWLHCEAVQTMSIKPDGSGDMMNVLIPAHYVTRAERGPKYRIKRSKASGDLGIFPPSKPTPANPVPLPELERLVADLAADPSLN